MARDGAQPPCRKQKGERGKRKSECGGKRGRKQYGSHSAKGGEVGLHNAAKEYFLAKSTENYDGKQRKKRKVGGQSHTVKKQRQPELAAKKRAARTGRNPKTKETIEIPASVVPVFKAGKALKDAVAK